MIWDSLVQQIELGIVLLFLQNVGLDLNELTEQIY